MGKYKAYPEYRDSGVEWVGKVPSHWEIFSLKRSVEGCTNGIWGSEPTGSNDLAVIRVADFERNTNRVGLDKLTYRSVTESEYLPRALRKGDLLIEKSGGGEKTLVGCVVLFEHDFKAVTSNFVARMRPRDLFNSNFLCYCFDSLYQKRVNYPSVKQTTGIQNLDSEAYLQERFCFPSFDEQSKIAKFLDHETAKIDTLIEKQERLIELLQEKRQAVISHAVTKGLDSSVPMKDSGVEWLGEVPEHWVNTRFKYIAELNPSKSEVSFTNESRCSFLPMDKLKLDYLNLDESRLIKDVYDGYTYFKDGDILVAKVTPCFENRNMAIARGLVNGIGFGSSEIYVLRTGDEDIAQFIYFRLQERTFMELAVGAMTGAGGLRRIPSDFLANFEFYMPPCEKERLAIIRHITRQNSIFEKTIEKAEESVKLMLERRTALISAAVTGKIDVRDILL